MNEETQAKLTAYQNLVIDLGVAKAEWQRTKKMGTVAIRKALAAYVKALMAEQN